MSYHDTDLIAYLYAYDGNHHVTEMIRESLNESVQAHPEEEPYHRGSRESTAAPENSSMCLELRFSSGPRTKAGFVFGAAKSCDFVLRRSEISNVHFAITFDERDRLIVRDLGSKNGTTVDYDGFGGRNKIGFQWIIGGTAEVQNKAITVKPRRDIAMLIDVNPFTLDSSHAERVARFREGTAQPDELLAGFDLSRRRTAAASTAQTPILTRILLKIEDLGVGGFGRVDRVWDVSTGRQYARKTPLRVLGNGLKDQESLKRWRREIDNMRSVDHDHIMRLLDFEYSPVPTLYMDYYPLGNIVQQNPFSHVETCMILLQCLDALAYLHEKQITHRDISPGNILITARSQDDFHVVLSDFGLSKKPVEGSELVTKCGTPVYWAPEMRQSTPSAEKKSRPEKTNLGARSKSGLHARTKREAERACQSSVAILTDAVDVWSLGVVVLEMAYGLPYHKGPEGEREWFEAVEKEASLHVSYLGRTLQQMLVFDHNKRASSSSCLHLARYLLDDPCPTPIQRFQRAQAPSRSLAAEERQRPTQLSRDSFSKLQHLQDLDHIPSPANQPSGWLPSLSSEGDPHLVAGGAGYMAPTHQSSGRYAWGAAGQAWEQHGGDSV